VYYRAIDSVLDRRLLWHNKGVRLDLSGIPGVLGEICRQRQTDLERALWMPERPLTPAPSLYRALRQPGLSLIAEIKRRSPSQGALASFRAAEVARAYAQGGAQALSVLTEPHFFEGSEQDLLEARQVVLLPILRKDFVVDLRQIAQTRHLGASAVLLIVAVLGRNLAEFMAEAQAQGVEVLVEVHSEEELRLALELEVPLLGINNRDLRDLSVDLRTAPRLGALARAWGYRGLLVAESGYSNPRELAALQGFDGVLVGSSLVRGNWQEAVRSLRLPQEG